jgi:hypothetical protein
MGGSAAGRKPVCTLYVDRFTKQWVLRDAEGRFWTVPGDRGVRETPREQFFPTEESELEPVPGHDKHMLGITT